jgi:hypothetical protein
MIAVSLQLHNGQVLFLLYLLQYLLITCQFSSFSEFIQFKKNLTISQNLLLLTDKKNKIYSIIIFILIFYKNYLICLSVLHFNCLWLLLDMSQRFIFFRIYWTFFYISYSSSSELVTFKSPLFAFIFFNYRSTYVYFTINGFYSYFYSISWATRLLFIYYLNTFISSISFAISLSS